MKREIVINLVQIQMGSGCSGAKATNAIAPSTLNKEAHAHLKDLQGNAVRAGTPSKDEMNATLGRTGSKVGDEATVDDRCLDKDGTNRSHEQLWQAVEKDDTTAAEKYLDKLADKGTNFAENDLMDNAGQSMLHKAASLGYAEMLMLLLERSGSKPDLVNGQLATPLHLACRNDRESVVKFLIGCGVDVNTQDEHGQTPLLICCIHGHKDLASFLLESSIAGHLPEALDVDVKDHRGLTALNCASIKGELELVKCLVSRGGAAVNQSSPKGCTPLIYAARGGYVKVVQFLMEKKASPLKQDHAGGTVLHHAIEKGHLEVLEIMLANGMDVYSAIEIADNAGRTPLFEAVENMDNPVLQLSENQEGELGDRTRLVKMLVNNRKAGGFGAKPNVINFNGQTPLFQAVREGCIETVRILVEAGAKGDLSSGELVKSEEGIEDDDSEEFDSLEEKYFMEAFKNCMTPLHVATVLGYDEIAVFLIENAGANVNLQTNKMQYTSMHLAVLANKPEMIIELLTKAPADPMLEDAEGQSLLDMVYKYIPSYVESFQALLENLQLHRLDSATAQSNNNVATHYVDPDDERALKGVADSKAANQMYAEVDTLDIEGQAQAAEAGTFKILADVDESEIEVPEGTQMDMIIESIFGRKIALALICLNWRYKEMAIKVAHKQVEKSLAKQDTTNLDLVGMVEASTLAVSICCREKVIKVFNVALALFNHMVSSSKIDQDNTLFNKFFQTIEKEDIVTKLLVKSEESNTRITNKIHEALLDLSYHPKIGEDFIAKSLIAQIQSHYTQKSSNQKGLLAQLALMFKMINSFGLANADKGSTGTVMTAELVIDTAIPAIGNTNKDVKNAAVKILVDVQRLSGSVQEFHLESLNQKTKEMVWDKVCSTEVEKNSEPVLNRTLKGIQPVSLNVVNLGFGGMEAQPQGGLNDREEDVKVNVHSVEQQAANKENFEKLKAIVMEKGTHKDWTQREIALNSLQECFEMANMRDLQEQTDFLTHCTVLLKQSLEENNIQIYLLAVQAAAVFFTKALWFDVVVESMAVLLKAIILRTADTNTRVRKKSVDLINQVWEANPTSSTNAVLGKQKGNTATRDQISSTIAEIICDNTLQEKSIIGRIGLLIKRALVIESEDDLSKRSHQVIFGKDYEQLTEFACSWSSHKNTKVRQSALKLIVEMCRVNLIDPRGGPFKQRIINFILGLRPSLRDPLVTKINETCTQMQQENNEGKPKNSLPYINVQELELNVATKVRATSMDVRSGMRGAAARQSQGTNNKENKEGEQSDWAKLPNIGGNLNLPTVASTVQQTNQEGAQGQTIVLPFSQPITEKQKEENKDFIELFGEPIMTCTLSTTWSCRQAAVQKIVEQLHNLDPQRRDAMFGEINRQNMPVELTFKTFLKYCQESLNDPVLKNYILTLDLIQRALPIFFRNVSNDQLKGALMPLVSAILKKTSDLKQKLREASMTFCLYLAHQSPIGPQIMVNQVLIELKAIQSPDNKPLVGADSKNAAAANYGNSHMIASCLKLLQQYQIQTKIVEAKIKGEIFEKFLASINLALKHQNPQVRKEAEALFKVLYQDFGEGLSASLINQKPALTQKLLADAKAESLANNLNSNPTQNRPGMGSGDKNEAKKANDQFNLNRATNQIKDDFLNESTVLALLNGRKELLDQLRLPNMKKRQVAIVEIKKIVQSKISQVNSSTARDLFEPISLLMRQLLTDDAAEVYLEALNLLKYVVGSLAPHLSSLDLHLMMGSFIGLIVNNTVSGNMRIRVASDKVIVFFAKHNSIGSYVIAKEVLKNIERINKTLATQIASTAGLGPDKQDIIDEVAQRKEILCRFYSILNLLLQQFSIVLCYQPDFYAKSLDLVAETMGFCQDEVLIKNGCSTIIISLFQIDPKLLDQGVSKLEVSKKSHIRKVMIEFENLNQKTKGLQVNQTGTHGGAMPIGGDRMSSPNQSFRDTQQSFTSISTSGPGGVPASPFDRRQNLGSREYNGAGQNVTTSEWNSGGNQRRQRNSEVRHNANKGLDTGVHNFKSLEQPPNMIMDEMAGGTGTEWLQNQNRRRRGEEKSEFSLPDIDTTPGRKRSIAGGQTGAKQYGAAGFKKSEAIDRVGSNKPPAFGQGIMQGAGANEGMSTTGYSGAQSGYTPSITAISNAQRSNQANSMLGGSPDKRRRSMQKFNAGGAASSSGYDPSQSSAAQAANNGTTRPPMYVPGHRDGAISGAGGASNGGFNQVSNSITSSQMKEELSWNSKVGSGPSPSLAAQHASAMLGAKRPSFEYGEKERTRFGSNSRPVEPQQQASPGDRFKIQPMKEAQMKQAHTALPSSINAKPPMGGAMKKSAPPVATFAFKQQTTTYKEADKKGQYKPDIFNDDE